MKLTTNNSDRNKLEQASIKAKRLCKLYKCSLIDLMVMSMQIQAQNKKEQNYQKKHLKQQDEKVRKHCKILA